MKDLFLEQDTRWDNMKDKIDTLEHAGERLLNYYADDLRCRRRYTGYKENSGYFYEDYDKDWDLVRSICREFKKAYGANGDINVGMFLAKADYWVGAVYKKNGLFDRALKHLLRAIDVMEQQMLQWHISECYIRSYLCAIDCYIEKHSARKMIEDCIQKVNQVYSKIKDGGKFPNRDDLFSSQKNAKKRLAKLEIELENQKAIFGLDMFGQMNAMNPAKVWENLDNAGKLFKRYCEDYAIDLEQNPGKKAGKRQAPKAGSEDELNEWESTWRIKQYDTIQGTMGIFFKNLYFASAGLKQNNGNGDPKKLDELANIDYESLKDIYLEIQEKILNEAASGDAHDLGKPPCELQDFISADELGPRRSEDLNEFFFRVSFFKIAYSIFSFQIGENYKNTICLGNLAVLLHNYKNESIGDKDFKDEISAFLDTVENKGNQFWKREDGTGKEDAKEDDIGKKIRKLINYIFKTEENNMFALNLELTLGKKGISSETVTYEIYPALRQSSLKNCFKKMDAAFGSKDTGDEVKCTCIMDTPYHKLKFYFVKLHHRVTEYMKAAIVDKKDHIWENSLIGHYTRAEVVPLLINKKGDSKLRLQNVNYLNDPLEGSLFVGQLKRKVEELSRGQLEPAGASCRKEDSIIWNVINNYEPDESAKIQNSVYMACFTSRVDQLNMWNRYGDDGKGCSLQLQAKENFDTSTKVHLAGFTVEDDSNRYTLDDTKYPLYTVLYLPAVPLEQKDYRESSIYKELNGKKNGKPEENGEPDGGGTSTHEYLDVLAKYREMRGEMELNSLERKWWKKQSKLIKEFIGLVDDISKILEDIEKVYSDIIRNSIKDKAAFQREVQNTLMIILDLVRFLFKCDSYQDEREYRIIQYSSKPEYDEGSKGIPQLYINMGRSLNYKKICYGPCTRNFASKASYVLNIRKEISDEELEDGAKSESRWNVEVCRSKISYIGKDQN